MSIRKLVFPALATAVLLPFATLPGCPILDDDDDDSTGDDDDSSGDDDDSAAGDDDDAAPDPLPLDLLELEISCTGTAGARAQSSTWEFFADFEGWSHALDVIVLYMWDEYTFEGRHYIDGPFEMNNFDFSDEVSQWDQHDLTVTGWDTIEEAAAADAGTILDCFDANSNPNSHNVMVCGYDDLDEAQENPLCWLCGNGLGGADTQGGTVGAPFETEWSNPVVLGEAECTRTNILE